MLYEMAKKFDDWKGEGYAGSCCRGAVRGWENMGACSERARALRGERARLATDHRTGR